MSEHWNSKFTPEIAAQLVEKIAAGAQLTVAAEECGISVSAVVAWRLARPDFDKAVNDALVMSYEALADSLITIPDQEGDPHRLRLKSENIKWLLARRFASRYGDKVSIDVAGTVDLNLAIAEGMKRLLPMRDQSGDMIDITPEDAPAIEAKPTDTLSADARSEGDVDPFS